MSFNVKTISVFERQAKRLMKKEPTKGTSIGHNCHKIRLAIASKGKGKSGGARIITHLVYNGPFIT